MAVGASFRCSTVDRRSNGTGAYSDNLRRNVDRSWLSVRQPAARVIVWFRAFHPPVYRFWLGIFRNIDPRNFGTVAVGMASIRFTACSAGDALLVALVGDPAGKIF